MSDADSAGSHSRASKASRSAGGRVVQVRKQFEAASALPSPSARTTVSAPQAPAAKSALKTAGRKRKASQQRLAATAAVSPDASGSTPAAPPAKPPATSWRDVLMGNSPDDRHTIQALVAEVEQLKKLINNHRAQSDSQHDNCRQHRMESSPQTEHMLRYSKRQNLVVFGVAESSACTTPEALAAHLHSLLFGDVPSSAAPLVSCAYRLGKWKAAQKKRRAVLVELTTLSAKHRAFKASSRLRASHIRLDEEITPQQMQQRKGLSSDFLGLKVRGFKPFFRGTTLKYRDGGVVRQCAKGGANKIRAPAPTVPGPRPAHRPEYTNVAMDPAEVLRQAGVSVSEEFDLGPALPFTMGTASFTTVPAPQLQLLGSWAPFQADYLASVITRCRYTMLITMIALLSMCRCGLWVRDLLLFRPLFSLTSSGIWS
ncbi:TPA: hypothetical protein ACH3X3_003159 [Trebouxia sp. C0006]